MNPLPLDLSTFVAIFIFTFLFDLIDLNPQIGSFSFIKSFTYYAYYSIRVAFGMLAAVLLQLTGLIQNPLLLAFVAVIGSVSTLENFSLRIGGEDIADLPSLFDGYRKNMIDNELRWASQKAFEQQMRMVHELASKFSKDSMKKHSLVCLRTLYQISDKSMQDALERIEEIEQIAEKDETMVKLLLAMEIVDINPTYAMQLLESAKNTHK